MKSPSLARLAVLVGALSSSNPAQVTVYVPDNAPNAGPCVSAPFSQTTAASGFTYVARVPAASLNSSNPCLQSIAFAPCGSGVWSCPTVRVAIGHVPNPFPVPFTFPTGGGVGSFLDLRVIHDSAIDGPITWNATAGAWSPFLAAIPGSSFCWDGIHDVAWFVTYQGASVTWDGACHRTSTEPFRATAPGYDAPVSTASGAMGLKMKLDFGPLPVVHDRWIDRVRFVPLGDGRYDIVLHYGIRSNEVVPVDLSFVVSTTVNGQGTTSQTITHPGTGYVCTGTGNPPVCTGSCPVIANLTGVCEPMKIVNGETPTEECSCNYSGSSPVDQVDLRSGDRVVITISPAPGAVSETNTSNDQVETWFGTRADADCGVIPGRLPAPIGGQRNSPTASLVQLGVFQQGDGPHEYWGVTSANVTSVQTAGPGLPMLLLLGVPAAGTTIPGVGSVDLDLNQPLIPLYDGLGLFGPPNPAAVGSVSLPYVLPPQGTARLGSIQGVCQDPTSPTGLRLTARNDIGVQDVTALGTPSLTPLAAGNPFPFPRNAICPNQGPVSSAAGSRDGHLFSAVGSGFNATAPLASACVNGHAVDVFAVRPDEILFYLNPVHAQAIGGPLVIGTTGCTNALVSPDQIENWVFATPWSSKIYTEAAQTSAPVASGAFPRSAGAYAVIGQKASASEVDRWLLPSLPPATPIRAFLAEFDRTTGQILTRCAPSQFSSTPPATCFPVTQPESQMWTGAPTNPRQDVILRLVAMTSPTTAVSVQNNGGPGTAAFAGMAGIPGSATNPLIDPDGPFFLTLGVPHFLAVDQIPGVGATGAYDYMLIVSW